MHPWVVVGFLLYKDFDVFHEGDCPNERSRPTGWWGFGRALQRSSRPLPEGGVLMAFFSALHVNNRRIDDGLVVGVFYLVNEEVVLMNEGGWW